MRPEISQLPGEFLERLRQIIPSNKWDEIANTFSEDRPTTFRANTLKTTVRTVREVLEQQGLKADLVSWYPDAMVLARGRLRDLQETDIYKKGEIYVQSLNSMLPPLALDPQPGENILDLTAAPGSKTTQMACLMKNQGRITANDNNKVRFFKLRANLEMQGVGIAHTSLKFGETFGREHPEEYDRVLLDTPCSAEGRFNVREPSSYGFWKIKKVKEMAGKQKKLLYSALMALKPGGTLVYSTCTYAPEENEGVLEWALSKFGKGIGIEQVRFSIPNQMPGLSSWAGMSFDAAVRNSVRIVPTQNMEGFFVARIKKSASYLEKG